MRFSCVLFDVDGTLVDSAPLVIEVFEELLPTLGLPVPPRAELLKQVGPRLWQSLPALGVAQADLPAAVAAYLDRYVPRCLEPALFPGVAEVLRDLSAAGLPCATATSKEEPMAVSQMEHLGLTDCFTVIAGAGPGPDSTKATVVRDALTRLAATGADVSRPVLVGDRIFDLNGAREVGIECIAVGWGYAQPGEMDDADHHAATPADLLSLLLD